MEKQSTRKFLKLIVALVALFLLGASALMLASCKDEHVHSYDAGVVTTQPTCNAPGSKTFTCSECGAVYTEVIPATNDHAWEKIKVYANSCESEGWTVYECSVCHDQKQDDWTPKLDHQYEAVETVEETCTKDGYQIMQCSYCGDRYTDDQYSSEHKATGHKWIVNESPADPADLTDAEGWKIVKAADCLNAAQLQRTCSVCGETEEKVGAAALGHLMLVNGKEEVVTSKTANLCKPNTTLVDAEGNKIYAFECQREDCPVNVVVDARGTEKHYIKAVDHKMKTIEEHINCVDTATDKSYIKEICENCDTWTEASPKKTEVEPAGHNFNTVQTDGKTDVVVCIKDDGLATKGDYLDFMKATVGAATYYKNQTAYSGAWDTAYNTANKTSGTQANDTELAISRVCTRCGAPTVANGHNYIVAKYVDGSFTEFEKDEEGALVDYSKTVPVASMNCRYVQICTGCNTIAKHGDHANVSTATCRAGGVCADCGLQVTAQLSHIYVDISDILNADGTLNSSATVTLPTDVTLQNVYDAWKKLSATETWLVPVVGDCDSESTEVTVCAQCLFDAAKGTEVTWNQATEEPQTGIPDNAVSNTNAYVITNEFSHDYQPTYFALDAADTSASSLRYDQTSCQVGYKVAYVCTKCGDVFKNVPVANDPATKPADQNVEENDDETNEARFNAPKAPANLTVAGFFTDENGFVINTPADPNYSDPNTPFYASVEFDAKALEKALAAVDNNKGEHVIYLAGNYDKMNGYLAHSCIGDQAKLPFTCVNCGALTILDANVKSDDNVSDPNAIANTYTWATSEDVKDLNLGTEDKDYYLFADTTGNTTVTTAENGKAVRHVGTMYECGEHCNAVSAGGTPCSDAKSHATVTVTYDFLLELDAYYGNYTLKVANVGTTPKDASLVGKTGNDINNYITSIDDVTKVAACAAKAGSTVNYEKPDYDGYAIGDEGKFLVLVDEAGKAYNFRGTAPQFYYNSDGTSPITMDSVTVERNDIFFVGPATGATALDVAASVTPTTEESLEYALNNNAFDTVTENGVNLKVLTVELAGNIEVTSIPQTTQPVNRVVYDLNGHKLTTKQTNTTSVSNEVIFQNGSIDAQSVGASNGLFAVNMGGEFTLDSVDVSTAAGSAILVKPETTGVSPVVNVIDSTIVSTGYMGISTNAINSGSGAVPVTVEINIENTTITMNPNTFGVGGMGNQYDNTALMVNVPAEVTVTGSTFTANRQVIVLRGGSLEMSDTTLNLVAGYLDHQETGYEEDKLVSAWNDGNRVSHAALTMGHNKPDGAYQYNTTAVLSDVVFNVYAGATKVYVASQYNDETIIKAYNADNGLEPDVTKIDDIPADEMPVMVYLNANNLLTGSDIDFVPGWDAGTIQLVNCNDVTGIY